MEPRDGYIEGVPCWIDSNQPDLDAAKDFYGGLFGWEFENVNPPEAQGPYYIGRLPGGDVAGIAGVPEGTPPMARWNTYIWVDSADKTATKAIEAGGKVVQEPFDVAPHGRMSVLSDPEGAVFSLWEPREHKGSQVVNELGSLNFNTLNTRDPEGAKQFYGSVFGWETFGFDGSEPFWALAGYADHLEVRYPGFKESMSEMGVSGFEDVVASLNHLSNAEPNTPAHWGVTFAVDDADTAAQRAIELGGSVVVPPFDAPWVRMTVLSDPQGAMFTASKYVPENALL